MTNFLKQAALALFLTLLPAAAQTDNPSECGSLFSSEQYDAALPVCKRAAEQGDVGAQTVLGVMYEDSKGVPQDKKEAAKWYRLAAEQGDADAQHYLGRLYEKGEGVPQDTSEAAKWFHLAAEQGNTWAQFSLGMLYDGGDGVPQDTGEAIKWYRLAAEQWNPVAENVANSLSHITESILEDASQCDALFSSQEYAAAYPLCKRAAQQGYPTAQHKLGLMYEEGKGVTQDIWEAHIWFLLASETKIELLSIIEARTGASIKVSTMKIRQYLQLSFDEISAAEEEAARRAAAYQ